jgi:TolB-like protein
MSLFSELKRRNVFKVGAAYLVVAWLVLQLVSVVSPILELPAWFARAVLLLLVIGFPFALIVAWAFELTPEGIRPTTAVSPEQSVAPKTGQKLNRFVFIALALALILVIFDAYILTNDDAQPGTATTAATTKTVITDTAAREQTLPAIALERSIAVLPFTNLSEDPSQEYFADGLAEELLNKLAQVNDLQVAARTSSFAYKGRNEDMRVIGQELGVNYILEGSVRKSAEQLRITAQLIQADDGFHLWSSTYDRTLQDIFVIQDDIAGEVARALKITLGAGEFDRLGMTHNIEAYDLFLKGNTELNTGNRERTLQGLEYLRQAVQIDPEFALGWQQLGFVYGATYAQLTAEDRAEFPRLRQDALTKALALEPELLGAQISNASTSATWQESESRLLALLEVQGDTDATINLAYGSWLARIGRVQEALPYLQKARRLDPMNVGVAVGLSEVLMTLGDKEGALQEIERGRRLPDSTRILSIYDWIATWLQGDVQAHNALVREELASADFEEASVSRAFMERWLALIENPDREQALQALEEMVAITDRSGNENNYLAFAADYFQDYELVSEIRGRANGIGIWAPVHSQYRKSAAFKRRMTDLGMTQYWRSSGKWPDTCRPLNDTDFECM